MRSLLFISILLISFSGCRSAITIQNRKCEKANRAFELANYKYGCVWQTPDTVHTIKYLEVFRDTIIYVQVKADS